MIAALWWAYFDVLAVLAQRQLSGTNGATQAQLARDLYRYLQWLVGNTLTEAGLEFEQDVSFLEARFVEIAEFRSVTIVGRAAFGVAKPFPPEAKDSPWIDFSRSSLAHIEVHSLDASKIRLAYAYDIDRLLLREVDWPRKGGRPRTADEDDLDDLTKARNPSAEEVERVYRSLRKNYEDQADRVGAHGWYFSEMEVGRRHARLLRLRGLREWNASTDPWQGRGYEQGAEIISWAIGDRILGAQIPSNDPVQIGAAFEVLTGVAMPAPGESGS